MPDAWVGLWGGLLDCVDMGLDLSTDCAVVEFGRRFDADSCCIKRFCRRYEEESVLVIDAPETLVMLLEKLLGEDNIEYGFIEDDAEVGFVWEEVGVFTWVTVGDDFA